MIINESRRDFIQKYGECYVRITHNSSGNEDILFINDISATTIKGHKLGKDMLWTPVSLPYSKIEMDSSIPSLGAVNTGQQVVYLHRKIGKQYRQGYTYKNNVIVGTGINRFIVAAPSLTEGETIHSIFYPTYYSIEEGIRKILARECYSVAITNRYYISVSELLPYIYLGFMGNVIGRVNKSNGACYLFEQAVPLLEDLTRYVAIGGVENGI